MIHIELPLKPLSVNAAFQGRRFRTREAKQFENAVLSLLPITVAPGPKYKIKYSFQLKNAARTDCDNLIKILQDCLVKSGIITDDRNIYYYIIEKKKADKDSIYIEIESAEMFRIFDGEMIRRKHEK